MTEDEEQLSDHDLLRKTYYPHLDVEVVTAVPGGMMRMGMGR